MQNYLNFFGSSVIKHFDKQLDAQSIKVYNYSCNAMS